MKTVTSCKGLVGFVQGKGIFSLLIKLFGKTIFSHTTMGYSDNFLLEAVIPKVSLTRLGAKKKKEITWFKIKSSKKEINLAVESILNKYYGNNYSIKQIIGYVWVAIVKLFTGKIVVNPLEDGRKNVVCAELVLYYLRDELKLKEFNKVSIHDYKIIKDLFQKIKESSNFEEVKVKLK